MKAIWKRTSVCSIDDCEDNTGKAYHRDGLQDIIDWNGLYINKTTSFIACPHWRLYINKTTSLTLD